MEPREFREIKSGFVVRAEKMGVWVVLDHDEDVLTCSLLGGTLKRKFKPEDVISASSPQQAAAAGDLVRIARSVYVLACANWPHDESSTEETLPQALVALREDLRTALKDLRTVLEIAGGL